MTIRGSVHQGELREEGCTLCRGTGWVSYPSITLHEQVEWAWRLCGACAVSEPLSYGIEADVATDGDERYLVFCYSGRVKHLVTITGSALAAERDLRRLREGEVLRHDRRLVQEKGVA